MSSQSRGPSESRWFFATMALLLPLVGVIVWSVRESWLEDQRLAERSFLEGGDLFLHLGESRTPPADPERIRMAEAQADERILLAEVAAEARRLNAPEATAEQDVALLQTLLDVSRRANDGANPSGGLNEDFTDALRGKHARRFAVLPGDLPVFSATGQLLDRRGTPYFFHPHASETLDIRSAGPDRRLWTADDVVALTDR